MFKKRYTVLSLVTTTAIAAVIGCMVGQTHPTDEGVQAEAQAPGPPASRKKRPSAWYPRTEKLAPDEMFVVALGTGMPTPITRAQKSSAWYVELGNGDRFLFDCGTGSVENLFALRPDMAKMSAE